MKYRTYAKVLLDADDLEEAEEQIAEMLARLPDFDIGFSAPEEHKEKEE